MSPEIQAALIAGIIGLVSLAGTVVVALRGFHATVQATSMALDEAHRDAADTLAVYRDQLDRTLAEQHVRTLNERFVTAVEKLGDDKQSAVQLAGIYAMGALADEWASNRQACIGVLCGYLRMHNVLQAGSGEASLSFRADREIRRTVVRMITAHLRESAKVSWSDADLDFTGVVFDGGDFSQAHFSGGTVSFNGAQFSGGTVSFNGAQFSGGTVDFSAAQFTAGAVYFNGAALTGSAVNFTVTQFSGGVVDFSAVEFAGSAVSFGFGKFSGSPVNFRNARFSGSALNFVSAEFSDGTVYFNAAEFSGGTIYFTGASFSGGTVDFDYAKFSGGDIYFSVAEFCGGTVQFGDAEFSGGTLDFDNAEISGGTVNFGRTDQTSVGAGFSGGTINFGGTRFTGGKLDFTDTEFSGGSVSFEGAHFTGGTVDVGVVGEWTCPPQFDWDAGAPPPAGVLLPAEASEASSGPGT